MRPKVHRLLTLAGLWVAALQALAQTPVPIRSVTNSAALAATDPRSVTSDNKGVVAIGDPTRREQGFWVYSPTSADKTNSHSTLDAEGTGRFHRILPWQDDWILGSPFLSAQAYGVTNLWTIGDSHTRGQLNIAGETNWLSGGFMVERFRYPNILADRYGLNLTNLAVSGSAVSCGNVGLTGPDLSSALWQISQIGPRWSGIVTVMSGYNDGYLWQDSASVLGWFEAAHAAGIAALFSTNWAGASGSDWDGAAVSGWTTTGSVLDEGAGSAGKRIFPTSSTLAGNRISLRMTAGQTWAASLVGRIGLVLERWDGGGVALIKTNGVGVAQLVLDTMGNGYASTARRLPVLYTLDLSAATTVGIESLSGTNTLLGVLWIGSEADALRRRVVVSSPTPLGDYSIRSDGMISGIGAAAHRAAARFRSFPLWTTFAGAAIDPKADVYATDKSHPGPSGHQKWAKGFEDATRVSAVGAQLARSQMEAPVLRSSGALQVYGGGTVGQDYSRPSASISFAGGYGAFFDAMGGALGVLTNLFLRGNNVAIQYGGLSVLNASALGAVPMFPAVHLSFGGGQGYLDAYDYGTAAWKAMNYRSLNHVFDSGAVSVIGATLATNNFTRSSGAHLSFIGSQSYLDSYNYSNETFFPFNYRAKSHRFANGPLSVSASYLAVEDAPTVGAVHVAYGGGQGYVDSYDYGAGSAKPLNLRGSYVNIPMGPLIVTSGIGSGVPTNAAALVFADSGTAQLRASRQGGYMAAAMDGTTNEFRVSGNIRMTVDAGASNGVAPINLHDASSGTMKRVHVGAPGSGPGNGRALYIDGSPNAPSQLTPLTTAERDALVGTTAGTIVWNTTTTKAQVYTGSAWVDLH